MSIPRFIVVGLLGSFGVGRSALAQGTDPVAVGIVERQMGSTDSRLLLYAKNEPPTDRSNHLMVAQPLAESLRRETGQHKYWPYFTIGGALAGLVIGACRDGGCEHDEAAIGLSLDIVGGAAIGAAVGTVAGLIVYAIRSSSP